MRRRQAGFTLIELMVAMVLAMILIGVVAYVFQQAGTVREVTENRMFATREVQGALDNLERDLAGVIASTIQAFRFRMERIDVAAGPPAIRSDLIEFVATTSIAGQERAARIRYNLNGNRLERTAEALSPQAGAGYVIDATVPMSVDVVAENILSFQVRYLERRTDEMRTFIDPGTGVADPVVTGEAFVIDDAGAADGTVSASGTQMIFTVGNATNTAKLERLDPGDQIHLFFPTLPPPQGFTPGYYTVQRATPTEVFLVEFPPAAGGIRYSASLYPREIQVEARLFGRAPVSITRNIKLGGSQ